ncbi:MAG TPA: alpha/beta hydrolase [Rhodobacteraceae bacterium]|nr:alpha/beta hydrolase [Paracoccaceae bacterium]
METQSLQDGTEAFEVTIYEAASGSPVVLFAVGSGGQPTRHISLLDSLAKSGFTVVAPHFERLTSPMPSETDLILRARRSSLALDAFVQPGATVAGVGHSIGAATLIALAGAQMWLGPGRRVNIAPDTRLTRLALLAPPTGFFQAPGALDAVRVPILVWGGSEDSITPAIQTEWLAHAMSEWQKVDVRITEGAGHFSFMDQLPPQTAEPLPNKQAFLREYSSEVCKFMVG